MCNVTSGGNKSYGLKTKQGKGVRERCSAILDGMFKEDISEAGRLNRDPNGATE